MCVCAWGLQLLRKFEQQRVSLLREYTNFDLDSPYELAMYYVRQVRGHHHVPIQPFSRTESGHHVSRYLVAFLL